MFGKKWFKKKILSKFWSTYSFVRLSLQKQWETHRCEQSEGWGRGAQGRAGWPRRTWCSWKPTQGTTRTQSRWKAQAPLELSLRQLAGVVQGLHIRLPQREAHPPSLREDLQPMFSKWQCPRLLRPHLQVPPPHLRMLEAIFFTNDYQFNRKYLLCTLWLVLGRFIFTGLSTLTATGTLTSKSSFLRSTSLQVEQLRRSWDGRLGEWHWL